MYYQELFRGYLANNEFAHLPNETLHSQLGNPQNAQLYVKETKRTTVFIEFLVNDSIIVTIVDKKRYSEGIAKKVIYTLCVGYGYNCFADIKGIPIWVSKFINKFSTYKFKIFGKI